MVLFVSDGEEHMACLDQQHSEKEGHAVIVVEGLSISDLDDSSNLDCIYFLKGHNYFVVVGFAEVNELTKKGQD